MLRRSLAQPHRTKSTRRFLPRSPSHSAIHASAFQNQRKNANSTHPLFLLQRVPRHEPRQRAVYAALAEVRLEGVVQGGVEGFELRGRRG
jgi:hypothetical protein